jgi:hypothetical protein
LQHSDHALAFPARVIEIKVYSKAIARRARHSEAP